MRGAVHMQITTIGLDIAKNVFAVHGIDAAEKVVVRKQLRRGPVATGRFLTVVPDFALRLPRRHPLLRALPVELPNSRHPVAIRTLKNRQLSPLAQLFCERVRALTKPLAKL